jgi:hypothetical protein
MNLPDISNLDYAELAALKNGTAERMKDMRDAAITQLRATIAEQAELLDVTIEDLVPRKKRKARRQPSEDKTAD